MNRIMWFCLLLLSSEAMGFSVPNEYIRKWVEDISVGIGISIGGERIYCTTLLPQFYMQRQFTLAWADESNTAVLIEELSRASESGLVAEDYHFKVLNRISPSDGTPEELAASDMLLTDALLLYSSHLLNGKVNPETIDSEWKTVRRENISITSVEQAIANQSIHRFLAGLEPGDVSYACLKAALKTYRMIAEDGGWPVLPEGLTLKPGMQDSTRIPLLIRRLHTGMDMTYSPVDSFTYTQQLADAVTNYQHRNGLDTDGNLGKKTTASMNIPVQQRIDQIIVNLERHRWLSHSLGDKYVFVNIAGYYMHVVENEQVVLSEKVIVGRPYRKTPVFSAVITYFVLNPYWTVPPVILYNDILPEMKSNPGYLASKNIKVFDGQGAGGREVDPATMDWSGFDRSNFAYTLRQDPGRNNALGQVKFMFPNKYNVYMHDTPTKELFDRTERTFSSGCIRLNHAMALVEYLIRDDPDLSMENITSFLAQGRERTVLLKEPINIHIQYLTCWADEGKVYFGEDVYARDQMLLEALKEKPSVR